MENTEVISNNTTSSTWVANAETAMKAFDRRTQCTQLGAEYTVKVDNVTPYQSARGLVHICSLNAVSQWHIEQAVEAYEAEDYETVANLKLTASPRDGKDFIPSKGQLVNIVLGTVVSSSGVESVQIISMSPLPKAIETKKSLADLLKK